eukprot:736248_1
MPSLSYNWYEFESEESDDSKSDTKNIGIAKVKMNEKISSSDEALEEFTLAAGSHINLRLWQFIIWQIGFVVVGMCLCGSSILIYNKCCN